MLNFPFPYLIGRLLVSIDDQDSRLFEPIILP